MHFPLFFVPFWFCPNQIIHMSTSKRRLCYSFQFFYSILVSFRLVRFFLSLSLPFSFEISTTKRTVLTTNGKNTRFLSFCFGIIVVIYFTILSKIHLGFVDRNENGNESKSYERISPGNLVPEPWRTKNARQFPFLTLFFLRLL